MAKHIKLFRTDSERILFEQNEYVLPHVSVTLENNEYNATIGGVQEYVINKGDHFIVGGNNYPQVQVYSMDCFIGQVYNTQLRGASTMAYEIDTITNAQDGQDSTFEINGNVLYGKWHFEDNMGGWILYTTSDYNEDNRAGMMLHVVITSNDTGRLIKYNKTKLATITLSDNSVVYLYSNDNGNELTWYIIDEAFDTISGYDALQIKDILINDNTSKICDFAFNLWNDSMKTLTISSSVVEIGDSAFSRNSGLTSITCLATTPPTLIGTSVFDYTNDCPIYVPSESLNAYKAATGWSEYASRIQSIQ